MAFNATDQPISGIFNKSVFRIPRNQRRYVWKKKNWKELLDDIILSSADGANAHFIGSVVLKDDEKRDGLSYFTIIDGQQRLTTITLVLLAIMKLFRERRMSNEFLGTIDYIQSKNNRNQIESILCSEYHLSIESLISAVVSLPDDDSSSISSFADSHILSKSRDKAIGEALKFYYFEIKRAIELFSSSEMQNGALLKIRNSVIGMILVQIVSTSEEDSYTIFEILNARGQALEDFELLKNYIMRYIQPVGERDNAKAKWEEMESKLGSSIKRFIYHYTTHRFGKSKDRGDSDYRIVREYTKGANINALLDDIKLKSEYYMRFIAPTKDGEDANCSECEYIIFNFFKTKKQEQFRPVILSLIHQRELGFIDLRTYEQTIKYIYNFYVCYNIIGEERSNKLQDVVVKYARMLEDEYHNNTLFDFAQSLKNKLPSFVWFSNAFSNLGWSNHTDIFSGEKNKTRAQIVLEIIEMYVSQRFSIDDYTIEHILPDSSGELSAHIGNLIPLEKALNDRCGAKSLAEKLQIYSESNFRSARGISERCANGEFDPNRRTDFLARLVYNNILQLDQFNFARNLE